VSRVGLAFTRARRAERAAFMPFLVAGDPSLRSTLAALDAYEAAGADVVEVGFPYSDPLADGPVIQRANRRSLEGRATVAGIFDAIREFRERSSLALVAMASASLLERAGPSAFARDAAAAGFDSLLAPDLPIDLVRDFFPERPVALPLVHLVAPTTPAARAARIAKASQEFTYVVSLAGVTGSGLGAETELSETIARVRAGAPRKPVAVGFGVATPADAAAVARLADGVIVGSALVEVGERRAGDLEALREAAAAFAAAIAGAAVRAS
jgi:tryptophan synthase alpha chain